MKIIRKSFYIVCSIFIFAAFFSLIASDYMCCLLGLVLAYSSYYFASEKEMPAFAAHFCYAFTVFCYLYEPGNKPTSKISVLCAILLALAWILHFKIKRAPKAIL